MSEGISVVSAISYDSSLRTEQAQKAEQPKETSATINENDRAELSAEAAKYMAANSTKGKKGQSRSLGKKNLDNAGDIANTVIKKTSGLKNGESGGQIENTGKCKATDNIKDPATVRMLKQVPGYEDLLNKIYKNAVPEVKKMYEKYEGKIKFSDADLMTSDELGKFNFEFAETISKRINEAKKGNQANQGGPSGQPGMSVMGNLLEGLSKADPVTVETFKIKDLLSEAQKPINASDPVDALNAFAKKDQVIKDLTSKLTEAYGDDINGLKAAVIDNIASTGYNTDKIASAKSVKEIVDILSSLSAEGAYYLPGSKSIHLDAPSDMTNSVPPGRTYFHEVGHLMDDAAYTKDDTEYCQKIDISDNPEFRKAIKDDFQKYVDKYKKEHKDEISRIIKCCEGNDATASEKMSKKEKDIVDYIEKHPEIREKYSTEDIVAYRLISGMMQENVPKEENGGMTNLQLYQAAGDIVGGLTDNICAGYWSHPNEYWKSSDSAITAETFAHMFQLSMHNGAELQKLKEIFPTAYEKFIEIVKQAS